MLEKEGPEGPPDSPPIDRSNASVKALVRTAKKRGYVTHDEINSLMKEVNSEQIEDVLAMLNEMGINVIETEEAETEEAGGEEAREEPEEEESDGELVEVSRSTPGRDQEVRARRAHRRSRAHVSARDGLGRAALPRGRNRDREAHRGRPRGDDRGPVREPADLPGDHHLARRAQRRQGVPARHHRSRSDLCRARRQECARRSRRATAAATGPRRSRRTVAPSTAPAAATPFRAKPEPAGGGRGVGRAAGGRARRGRSRRLDVARGDRGRAQAQGARDLRQGRRFLQAAAPAPGPGHPAQAQEHVAHAPPGAQVQEAQGRDHRRGEVAAPQPGAHRFARRAALRHQQAPRRLRGPHDAALRKPRRHARGFPEELHRLGARSALAQPRLQALGARLEEPHRPRQGAHQGAAHPDPCARRRDGPRDPGIPQDRPDGAEGRARGAAGEEGDGGGEPAPRHLDRQEIHQPRPAVPRPDPGRQHRPDEGGRQVRVPPRLQVRDLRHVGGSGRRSAAHSPISRTPSASPCT